MDTALLKRLKACSRMTMQSKAQLLCRRPWSAVKPYALARVGRICCTEAQTFFGRRMLVVLPEMVSVSIWRYGVFEQDVAFYMMLTLNPGDTFIDIGGHFGFFSMLGRELVGPDGTVVIFEPMLDTRAILQENMERFAASARHHLIAAAAGSAPGKLTFKDFGLAGSAFATSGAERNANLVFRGEVEIDVCTVAIRL
ncbi:MAG: FkbM family methyltransferase [Rhodospirillales bacterium]|nr:FkbM family methyltransferase [Rhodospirillales bacterium]